MHLILFTESYPWSCGNELAFIQHELPRLRERFRDVLVVPEFVTGPRYDGTNSIDTDTALAKARACKTRRLAWSLPRFTALGLVAGELRRRRGVLCSPAALWRVVAATGMVGMIRRRVPRLLAERRWHWRDCLFYTFWLDARTVALASLKSESRDFTLVSRAHGYDLFDERYEPPSHPFREDAVAGLDHLFLSSDAARDYAVGKFPALASRASTAYLGVTADGTVARPSADGTWRLLSCSSVKPVKRLDRLVRGLMRAGALAPSQRLQWTHVGGGPGMDELQHLCAKLPDNVDVELKGDLPNRDVLRIYRETPVDCFINMSESEGGMPVAIMEAFSFGVPAIAPAVGGIPEGVSDATGRLLNAAPSAEEIAAAIVGELERPERLADKRVAAQRVWREKFDAERTSAAFADRLCQLACEIGQQRGASHAA